MLETESGKDILTNQPRWISNELLDNLADYDKNTLGYAYYRFMTDNQITPDSRPVVRYVPDYDLAYIMQRYREIHDFLHVILGCPEQRWLMWSKYLPFAVRQQYRHIAVKLPYSRF